MADWWWAVQPSDVIDYMGIIQSHAHIICLIFVRLYAVMAGCTLFDKSRIPMLVRSAMCIMFAVLIGASQHFNYLHIADYANSIWMLLIMKEAIYGYLIGILLSTPFLLVESFGKLIDQQRGEQFAAVINPLTQNLTSSCGKLILQSFFVYFIMMHGIDMYINIMFNSFDAIRLDSFLPQNPVMHHKIYIKIFTDYCYWMTLFALPAILISFIVDLVLGMIGSFVPQLNITMLSIPIKSVVVSMILLFIIGPVFVKIFHFISPITHGFFPE